MEKADDNTLQFYSPRQDALPRSPTPSDNSPQPRANLIPQLGNIAPKPQTVPSYAEFTRAALSSKESLGVMGAYPDDAPGQPSRSTEPRLADNPTTADNAAASRSRERTSKNRKHISRSRSGQPLTSIDNANGVAATPISSAESSGMFASKEVPTSSRNVPHTRAPQATGTDSSRPPGTAELGERNPPLLPQADSPREGNTIKPLAQVVGRTPSVGPSPKPSTHSAPTLNQPSVSTSSSPFHVAPTITRTASSWTRTPHSKLPNEPHGDPYTDRALSELPRPPDKGKGIAHSNERSHTNLSAPSGTPPLPPDHSASAAGPPSRPQPESGPRGLDRGTSRIRGNEGAGRESGRVAEGLTSAKGETRPVPILPSNSMQSAGQPYSAVIPLVPQKETPMRSPPETGDDTPSRLPGDRRREETHASSLVQEDPPQKAVENKPQMKPSDQIGHTQSSARAAPPISKVSSNIVKERGSQAQLAHSISQPQHSRNESSGILPSQQHRTDPLIARETGLPSSEHAAAIGVPSFPHFRPIISYVPVHPDETSNPERSPPPPPYQPSLSPGVPVAQEGTASTSGARIASEVRDEPKKLPASLVLEAPHHPNDQGHLDRSGEIKQLLLPTRDDAVAAVCPPPGHSQSVEVYRNDRNSHSFYGVRQRDALSSPKILDRSRSGSSVEQDNKTNMTPPAPQKRPDLPVLDIQHEVGSHKAGSFDRHREGGPRGTPDGGGPLAQNDDDTRLSQGPSKPPVPEVVLIPPTRPTSPIHKPLGAVPPEYTRIARAHPEPSRRAPTPPEPFGPAHTPPAPMSLAPTPDDRSSDRPARRISERIDLPVDTIKDSLSSLKDSAMLAERIPRISTMADVLLQVLTTQIDVTQHEETWGATKDNVRKLAGLVSHVGRTCEDNNLEAVDLPHNLPTISQSLVTELGQIGRVVEKRETVGSFKKFFLDISLRRKVKKYDRKVFNKLQAFHATVAFNQHFSHCAERIEVVVTKVNTRYDKRQTPLHVASQLGQLEVMRSLIDHGAKPNSKNAIKETPLFMAARNGNIGVTRLLLKHGADVNHPDLEKRTPLHESSENGHVGVVKLLLAGNARVDDEKADGETALHLAASYGHVEVVRLLISHHADLRIRNNMGEAALDLAREKGHESVVQLLLRTAVGGD